MYLEGGRHLIGGLDSSFRVAQDRVIDDPGIDFVIAIVGNRVEPMSIVVVDDVVEYLRRSIAPVDIHAEGTVAMNVDTRITVAGDEVGDDVGAGAARDARGGEAAYIPPSP